MRRAVLVTLVAAVFVAWASVAVAQQPCTGGCDAEYWNILTYDPYRMWETYGYPVHADGPTVSGCWWYWIEPNQEYWYMCPPDGNLYVYGG